MPARRPARGAGRSRHARAFRRTGAVGFRRHGAGRHPAAGTRRHPGHAGARAARLGPLRRTRSQRHLALPVGAALRGALAQRRPRLAGSPRHRLPACGQLGRARALRRRQQPAALPHHLGHRAADGPPPRRGSANGRLRGQAHLAAPTQRDRTGVRAGTDGRGDRAQRRNRRRSAAGRAGRGDRHRRHQRQPRAGAPQLADPAAAADADAQRRQPAVRRQAAPDRHRLRSADHPRRRDVELRRRHPPPQTTVPGPRPVADSLQVGAVAGPSRPADRPGAAGHRFRYPRPVPAGGRAGWRLDLAPAQPAHRRARAGDLRRRAQPAHPRPPVPAFPARNPAGQRAAGGPDASGSAAIPRRRQPCRAGGADERADRQRGHRSGHPASHGRCLRRQLHRRQDTGKRRPDPRHPARPAMATGPPAHLQAGAAAEARLRPLHRHPDPADHAQEPGRAAHRSRQPRARRQRPADRRAVLRRRSGGIRRRRLLRQALAGRHLPARLHPHRPRRRPLDQAGGLWPCPTAPRPC